MGQDGTATQQPDTGTGETSEMIGFIRAVAHELRTPVTSVKTHAELLLGGAEANPNLDPKLVRALEAIRRGADRIERIARNISDVALIESGRLRVFPQRTDLAEIVERARKRIMRAYPARQIDLHLRGIELDADPARIEQVAMAMLDNAVRYSPNGEPVEVDLATEHDGRDAVLRVRDHGVGIEPERQARIGERFYRAHAGTELEFGGTGASLWIARLVIEAHGGKLELESTPGKGSTFRMVLPRRVAT